MNESETTPDHIYIPKMGRYFDRATESNGWDFGHGDPELFALREYMLSINGTVLDLGAGSWLRASGPFAVDGLCVTAVDSNLKAINDLEKIKLETGFRIDIKKQHMMDYLTNSDDEFDLILLAHSFAHFTSKKDALDIIKSAFDHVKPGGQIWIRAGTILDEDYTILPLSSHDDPSVRLGYCDCSGEERLESMLFFDPLEIHLTLANVGARITHSQVIPELGKANIKFGEDWQSPNPYVERGFVTVLATKPI